MVWRIHFTPADLGRIRVGAALGPLAETLMALCLIRSSCQPPARLGGWKERAGRQLTAQMKPLAALFPAGRPGVDLWTLTGYAPTIEDGVGALLKVPREHLLAEMTVVDRRSRLPASAWAVADEGSDARLRFADAVLAAYRVLVEPHWTGMNSRLRAEQAYRGHILANGGVEHLLATIQGPRVRWRPPVLELLGVGHGDVYLDGRGLALVPSLFVGEIPFLLTDLQDAGALPLLIFSADGRAVPGARRWATGAPGASPLTALVGRTRAAVLTSIAGGCSTTEIARRAGISLAAASQHATVLRDAGLITTHRHGREVLHTVTALGADLLGASSGEGA